jgi:hypothetical protein
MKVSRMRWAENVARIGEKRNTYKLFVRKPEVKTPRPRRRWMDNIRMNLVDVGWAMWTGYVARMGEKKNVYRLLVGKP